jgi:uncharacterized membrane protein required for colicin V production
MIMWIAALVLVALTIGIGYRQGAIRAALSFVGLIIAAMLAIPCAPLVAWIFPLIGFKNPLVAQFGAPIIAFFVISLVFKGLAAFVHRKVDYHYKYNRDDATRAVWEVMHRRVGACIGALNGVVYFLVFALIVAVFGYFTIQTGASESESKVLSFLGKSAEDLQSTHMDKVVAPFNPAREKYFEASDILGLLHHNRGLIDRLKNYPVFAAMAEEPVYQSLGQDQELQNKLKGQSSLNEILAHPKVQEVVSNSDIVAKVLNLDMQDLKHYLETGVSEKFGKEKLLGRWAYDASASIQLNKQLKPDVTAPIWMRMKNELMERFNSSVFTAFYDNKATFQLRANMEGRATAFDPLRRLPNGQTNYVAHWFTTNAMNSSTGKWSGSAPNYLVTLGNKNGAVTTEGRLEGDSLSFQLEGKALSFTRLPD